MDKWQRDVRDFHEKFGLTSHRKPNEPISPDDVVLRRNIVGEECIEVLEALDRLFCLYPSLNTSKLVHLLAEVADGIADLIYVLHGTAVTFGIDMEPIWDAVHAANMTKEGGGYREDGKILKPEGWEHPNVELLLGYQTH